MTRIVGKIYENTKENKENKGAASGSAPPGRCRAPEVVFFDFLSIFVYFANNPSHWDGNPGIGIVNPNNPKQSQSRQKPGDRGPCCNCLSQYPTPTPHLQSLLD